MDQHDETASRIEWLRSALARFETALTRYAARLLNGDIDRARDVVQDTFLRLWETPRDQVEDHLTQWLYTVCRNKALDVQRKERRMTSLTDEQMQTHEGRAASSGIDPDAAALSDCSGGGGMLDAVQALPDRQQELIRLKFQSGLSYREIAGVMNLSVTNVGVLLHTAIKALRGMLTAQPGAIGAETKRNTP